MNFLKKIFENFFDSFLKILMKIFFWNENTSLWCTGRGFCRSSQLDKWAEQPDCRHLRCPSRTRKYGIHPGGCDRRQKGAELSMIRNRWISKNLNPDFLLRSSDEFERNEMFLESSVQTMILFPLKFRLLNYFLHQNYTVEWPIYVLFIFAKNGWRKRS